VVVACGGGDPHSDVTKPRNPDSVAAGAVLYVEHCASCHGEDLTGGDDGPNLVTSELGHPDADFVEAITDGKDDMPGFGSKLSAEEINALVDFVRTAQAAGLEE
jgi:cytochrome c551